MSGQKVKKSSKDDIAANGSVSATMQKAFKKNSTWEDKKNSKDWWVTSPDRPCSIYLMVGIVYWLKEECYNAINTVFSFVHNALSPQDEFLDVIYWFRQVLAIMLGIIWGILPLKGILAIGLFALINAGVLYIYFTNFQKIDEEEYGGPWELTKEGFMTSFALFLVVWIIFYSAIHFP